MFYTTDGEQELEKMPTHILAASQPPALEQKPCWVSPRLQLLVLTANPRGVLTSVAGCSSFCWLNLICY